MIRRSNEADFEEIWAIINDGAEAYRGIIPADRWTEPYMSREKLQHEIQSGVEFWGFEGEDLEGEDLLVGMMGIQKVHCVTLIRHAYVLTSARRRGIGGKSLAHLRQLTANPILIGTWADAGWAICFYERHGFALVTLEEKERLLRQYWSVPERQIETSVVLADSRWRTV